MCPIHSTRKLSQRPNLAVQTYETTACQEISCVCQGDQNYILTYACDTDGKTRYICVLINGSTHTKILCSLNF